MRSQEAWVEDLRSWAAADPDIVGIAISSDAGSVVVVAAEPARYLADRDWMGRFAAVEHTADGDWGVIRVRTTDGDEVEFGFTDEPRGGEGQRIVHDPRRLLRLAAIAAEPGAPQRETIHSACGRYERDVWLVPGPAGPLCVFLDAEFYLHDVKCLRLLRRELPPMSCVFVSFADAGARHADFTWNPHYARFIAEDVRAWAAQRGAVGASGDDVICGLSLSGLAAAHIALERPDAFSRALCQSASFWWLVDNPAPLPETRARMWLSVGSQETERDVSHAPTGLYQRVSQIEGVDHAGMLFEARGARVHRQVFSGGHAFAG